MEQIKAVSEKTLEDLEILKKAEILREFYLGGGTGLAFLLNHRESRDLDFFSEKEFNESRLIERLSQVGKFSLEKKEKGTIRGYFKSTALSFFYYPYPLIKAPAIVNGISVASFTDIGCMKIDAIASRGTKRDFIDVYVILQKTKISFSRLIRAFSKKYASLGYNLIHIKKSLVYFNDAEEDPMPKMIAPVKWETVKDFFIAEIKKL